jgi:AsmA family protein
MVSLFDAINPLRKKTDKTILDCAVAYLPVSNGLVTIKDSVGIETDRLDVVLSGDVNLKTESINLNIYPREKSGLTTGLDLANLVKVQGTLQHPELGINKQGVVNSAVAIGLGFLTGGASILAENARSMATKSNPCKTALHPWSNIYPSPN